MRERWWLGLSLACGLALQAAGCAAVRPPTVRKSFTDEVLPRASFELQCPKEQIELVQLATPLDDYVQAGAQVGVKACGKQAVYVCSRTGWVANTVTTEPAR